MWTMGYNDVGELGHNNRTERSSPTQVPGTNWNGVALDGGEDSFAALRII